MTDNEKIFDFKVCPWCGSEYRDRQVVKVQCDIAGPHILFVHCDGCGVIYRVERVISWRAEKVAGEKSPSQEVAEFLEDRNSRIEKARPTNH